jgi:hypothetical protein
MGIRETVLSTITTVLDNDFDNVVNMFRTVDSLLSEPTTTSGSRVLFPWVNVNLGSHNTEFDLNSTIELEARIPVLVTAYDLVDEGELEDLHIIMARLIDNIMNSLTSADNRATFCANNVGIDTVEIIPAEDEMHFNVCVALMRVNCISGDT